MGFFLSLFNSGSERERQPEETYIQIFQSARRMSASEARTTVRTLILQAKQESQAEGTANFPPDFGDRLLAREATDDKTRAMLATKRREGVTGEDIRWWWNMPDLERRMFLKDDDLTRYVFYNHHRERGLSSEEAAARVRKYFPMYGDPNDTAHASGEDRLLPDELRDRVNIWVQRRTQHDPDAYKVEIENSPTFNALVRKGIRNREI